MKEILFSSFYQAYQKGDLHVLNCTPKVRQKNLTFGVFLL